ncbi:hypothetical protein A5634_09790 [Mycobacterium asiaticum]|uniref:LysM domain-containing protein n=1 Tax=Mycobacterium asiaticum TaxID=1790 RepID=A0A1A3NHS1_MYCAS|nr:LysM peptidoglycan-binding domain-containing protein [Mycobacterium asiaticum]OBK21698.1 hypothetical protein A5634_09790 [Mycobacterium asiaticum]
MTISYAGPQRTCNGTGATRRNRPVNRPVSESPYYRTGQARHNRPGPSRPGGGPLRYHGTGVAMSTAPHRRRPVSVATTVGLALLAGVITLWLGLMANFGSMTNEAADTSAAVPAALAVVRVEPGESLQQLAARVAPGAPVRDVVERIRDLNALDSNAVSAGQTLIAPVG